MAAAGILVLTSSYVKSASVIFNIVTGLIVGEVYDFVWFCTVGLEQWGEIPTDGGLERGVRKFSIVMSVVSFFYKVSEGVKLIQLILMAIVWKFSSKALGVRDKSSSEMRESNISVASAVNPFEA